MSDPSPVSTPSSGPPPVEEEDDEEEDDDEDEESEEDDGHGKGKGKGKGRGKGKGKVETRPCLLFLPRYDCSLSSPALPPGGVSPDRSMTAITTPDRCH